MDDPGFRTFGLPHLAAMAATVVIPVLLIRFVRSRPRKVSERVGWILAGVLLTNDAIYWTYRIRTAGLDGFVERHLPLHLCGAAVMLTAITLLLRNRRAYELAWFWGMVGSLNAVITPGGIETGFPAYRFFQYFVAHSGIVIGVLYATFGLGMRPDFRGLVRAFAALNLFAAGVAVANWLLGSNYMYLSSPPPDTVSPFFLAPWPWYLLILEVIGLAMFLVVLAPFALYRRRRAAAAPR